jgi:hypothetical protein
MLVIALVPLNRLRSQEHEIGTAGAGVVVGAPTA